MLTPYSLQWKRSYPDHVGYTLTCRPLLAAKLLPELSPTESLTCIGCIGTQCRNDLFDLLQDGFVELLVDTATIGQ